VSDSSSTTFTPNQKAPIHRWFRYSAGFSGLWAERVIAEQLASRDDGVVLDPFAGIGTTLVAGHLANRTTIGLEAHPLVYRLATAKLGYSSNPSTFQEAAEEIVARASNVNLPRGSDSDQPAPAALLGKIFDPQVLLQLRLLQDLIDEVGAKYEKTAQDLLWLGLMAILRSCSGAGTAPWQYVLPKKTKAKVLSPIEAFAGQTRMMAADMVDAAHVSRLRPPRLMQGDARTMTEVMDGSVDLVLTSPPYPNNYDYADATRIELTFLGEIARWRDLHDHTRRHLMVSCSQHARSESLTLDELLLDPALGSIRHELESKCRQLQELRQTRKGKKQYDTMAAAYFRDMSHVLHQTARVLRSGGRACFVVGDSAPYGIHLPVERWLAELGASFGLALESFEQTRERNVKWKNRKHRVPLKEGRLWLKREGGQDG
jgi:DNA modification methylase